MESLMSLAIGALGGALGAIITGFFTNHISERKIKIENVTQERAKWREKIRTMSIEVHQSVRPHDSMRSDEKLDELHLGFSLNLNPCDQEDKEILCAIKKMKQNNTLDNDLSEFSERVALMLKHDWERAKYESESCLYHLFKFICKLCTRTPERFKFICKLCTRTPERISYCDYKKKHQHPSGNHNDSGCITNGTANSNLKRNTCPP